MEDPSGSTAYLYERRGLARSEAHVIDGSTYTATYGYDPNGNRTMVTYPSGRVVDYTFDFADRPLTAAASEPSYETYVSDATYAPFGPVKTLTFGNGTRQTFTVDTRYMPYQNKLEVVSPSSTLADFSYTHDGVGNITAITDNTDSSYSRSYGYDDLNRLITANSGSSLWGTDSGNGYTYDATGNMLSLTLGSWHTATFSYSGTTSLLSSVTEDGFQFPTVTYDSAGNEYIDHEGYTAHYSTRNLTDYRRGYEFADMIQYSYDGRGVRAFSRATISWPLDLCDGDIRDEVSVYSPELDLLYRRIALTPDCEQPDVSEGDFVWFGGRPVAEDRPRGPVRWLFADHLGTPIVGTDSSAAVDFQVEYEPFGSPLLLRVGDTPSILQLPGQEATFSFGDRPLSYNIFRWYHANWGRYSQPDPVGAWSHRRLRVGLTAGGIEQYVRRKFSTAGFGYANGAPTRATDPLGLDTYEPPGGPPEGIFAFLRCPLAVASEARQLGDPGKGGRGWRWAHCWASCRLTKECGGAANAWLFGWGKEALDAVFCGAGVALGDPGYSGSCESAFQQTDIDDNRTGRLCPAPRSCDDQCGSLIGQDAPPGPMWGLGVGFPGRW